MPSYKCQLLTSRYPQPRVGWGMYESEHYPSIDEGLRQWKKLYKMRHHNGMQLIVLELFYGHCSTKEGDVETHEVPQRLICQYKVISEN